MKYYDYINKIYLEIDVDKTIEVELKRSYWREEQQQRRYYKRVLELDDGIGYSLGSKSLEDVVILKQEIEILRECILNLNERDKFIIKCIYYFDMNNTQVAKLIGVSASYVGRVVKRIKQELKCEILKSYDYYAL